MIGVSATSFAPELPLSRAMAVTILHRVAQEPSVIASPGFSDVPTGLWYSDAVTWAYEHGIVEGVGGGRFAPYAIITREELATLLLRYAEFSGEDTFVPAGVSPHGQTSPWAREAMQWGDYYGLIPQAIQGETANPAESITRAESATIFSRIMLAFGM